MRGAYDRSRAVLAGRIASMEDDLTMSYETPELSKVKTEPSRLSCTYAEAVYLLNRKNIINDHSAFTLAYIFGRDQDQVTRDLIAGMPQ